MIPGQGTKIPHAVQHGPQKIKLIEKKKFVELDTNKGEFLLHLNKKVRGKGGLYSGSTSECSPTAFPLQTEQLHQ